MSICALACVTHCYAQEHDTAIKKTTSVIANLLNSTDPAQFIKTHNIDSKYGMIKIVITVDEKLLPQDFASRYGLKEFEIRKNTANAYIGVGMLKKMCEEPGVIFVRTPFKFKALIK
jgi:hypothetical protein